MTLSARDNKKLSNIAKGLKDKWIRYFLELNFVGINRLFGLVYPNWKNDVKRFHSRKYYLPKGIIKNYNIIISGKNFYDQSIDSDIKQYEEIRKLTAGQGEDYTTGYLLDYDYIKNHYRLIAVDLSRQKELDADPKGVQQIEFVGQLKKLDADGSPKNSRNNDESMFI